MFTDCCWHLPGMSKMGHILNLNDISMILANDCCSKRNMLVSATYRQALRAGLMSIMQCDKGNLRLGGTLWGIQSEITFAGGGFELFFQLPMQGNRQNTKRSKMEARTITGGGPSSLASQNPHLDDCLKSSTSQFEVLLWGKTLPTVWAQGPWARKESKNDSLCICYLTVFSSFWFPRDQRHKKIYKSRQLKSFQLIYSLNQVIVS